MMPCSEPCGLSHGILTGCGSFGSPSMGIWATVSGNDFFFFNCNHKCNLNVNVLFGYLDSAHWYIFVID